MVKFYQFHHNTSGREVKELWQKNDNTYIFSKVLRQKEIKLRISFVR